MGIFIVLVIIIFIFFFLIVNDFIKFQKVTLCIMYYRKSLLCSKGSLIFILWMMLALRKNKIIRRTYEGISEKAMATHFSTLAWKIPRTEEPGRLQSMGSVGVGHYWATSLSLFTFLHWRRKWQPTPVFLPGEFQGWGSLAGFCLWGRTESDMTEAT